MVYSFELVCAVLPIENTMKQPEKVTAVINSSMACYCTLMYHPQLPPARQSALNRRASRVILLSLSLMVRALRQQLSSCSYGCVYR